ncbi:MAG: RES domain-containing protein [Gammaproteobacteria bacterium]|nr:MAG: RES domain-containing protein [Gammaproteobacteria bacterium]
MLEQSKPPVRPGTERLHYLLATPFRYPPLRHGSRFGTRWEPSLFYGGTSVPVTLCEGAYYRFYFWHDNTAGPASPVLQTQHTLFAFRYRTQRGVRLQREPFTTFQALIRDPVSYQSSQRLGAAMRADDVEAFEYPSARDRSGGVNVALFSPAALATDRPMNPQPCLCQTRAEQVEFSVGREVHTFRLGDFLIDGRLPFPAA